MCLILFAYRSHPSFDLILAANRDEFYDRPAEPPAFWQEAPHVLAGRDLIAGGTWLGVTRHGRFAALTNYRDPASLKKNAPSRGRLVSAFLLGQESPFHYLEGLRKEGDLYNGFNIIVGDRGILCWYSNRDGRILRLPEGLYGLSNRLLDTPWPKVLKGKRRMAEILRGSDEPPPEKLFHLLSDTVRAPDEMLPSTGVDIEWEKALSSIFISSPTYGTRSSTLLYLGKDGRVMFLDRTFHPDACPANTGTFQFTLES